MDKKDETAQNQEPTAKEKLKDRISRLIKQLRILLDDIYIGEKTYSKLATKFFNMIKVFIISTRKFLKDDGTSKASSIAYATIVSLIPTLTVALTFYSLWVGMGTKKKEIFDRITLFMLEHNIKLNIDPVLETISSLIENAGKIGGIGAVVMIFSATAVLRTLEQALNNIWEVKQSRSLFLRIIYYWAALTLGPLMLISGSTVATQISTTFSDPNYNAAYITADNNLWITGNKARIINSPRSAMSFQPIKTDSIDFDNQRVFEYDSANNGFKKGEFPLELLDYKKTTFRDIQFIGVQGWAVGKDGVILITRNGGKTWLLEKWGSFNLNDIHMVDAMRGFIAADNGYLLITKDGGRNWEVQEWEKVPSNFNSIAFNANRGIIVGDKGVMLTTQDYGLTWKMSSLNEAKRKDRFVNLNHVSFYGTDGICIAGDEGTILLSNDGGARWINRKFQENSYYAAFFENRTRGFVAGDNGMLIHTIDGGEKWQKKTMPTSKINRILVKDKALWVLGDEGMIMKSLNDGKTWKGVEGRSFIVLVLNFLAPFAFIWLLFLLIYIAMPNTKVPFKPAAIGAAFTGTVWVIFILLFILYVRSFAGGTLAVYGALAAIPIFLLMIYASSVITLYGAEVSYTLMHPHTYRNLKKAFKEVTDVHVAYGISLIYHIYENFEKGKGTTPYKDLMKVTAQKGEEVEHMMAVFKKEGLIEEADNDSYRPTNSSLNIKLVDLIEIIHDVSLKVPPLMPASDPVKKYMQKYLRDMESSRTKIIGKHTLRDLIDGRI